MPGMPILDSHVFDITRTIQLAVAPVFLLTAIGTIINALAGRLGRAVDRRRVLEELMLSQESVKREESLNELYILSRRIYLVLWAMALSVLSALLVCLLIGTAFVGAFIALDLSRPVALLFVMAVLALTAGLVCFMREVFLAALSLRQVVRPQPERDERK
jgi:MFS family permease